MNESNKIYKSFILRYFQEEGITYNSWAEIQPLYLRYRARCLKMKPDTYQAFLNLCTFKSNRHCKYDVKGNLKEGETAGWDKSEEDQKREYAGVHGTGQQARMNYKLNYKAPPKKEDFEHPMEWRRAKQDWSYLKAELAEYAAVKAILNKPTKKGKPDRIPNEGGDRDRYHYMFEFPWLIRYALKCLGGTFPIECFPESLNDYRQELEEMLQQQREAYSKEPVEFSWDTKGGINENVKRGKGGI